MSRAPSAGGNQPLRGTGLDDGVPYLPGALRVDVDLEAVLAGVPGARDALAIRIRHPGQRHAGGEERAQLPQPGAAVVHARQRLKHVGGARALDGDEREPVADVVDLDVAAGVLAASRRRPSPAVDALTTTMKWLSRPPRMTMTSSTMPPRSLHITEYRSWLGTSLVTSLVTSRWTKSAAPGPLTVTSPMWLTSKIPGALAHGDVLIANPAVLQRHVVAGEIDHPGPGGDVTVVEWGVTAHQACECTGSVPPRWKPSPAHAVPTRRKRRAG